MTETSASVCLKAATALVKNNRLLVFMKIKHTIGFHHFYYFDIMFSHFCGSGLKLPSSTLFFGFTLQTGVPYWTHTVVIKCSIFIPVVFPTLFSVLTVLLGRFRCVAICDRNEWKSDFNHFRLLRHVVVWEVVNLYKLFVCATKYDFWEVFSLIRLLVQIRAWSRSKRVHRVQNGKRLMKK